MKKLFILFIVILLMPISVFAQGIDFSNHSTLIKNLSLASQYVKRPGLSEIFVLCPSKTAIEEFDDYEFAVLSGEDVSNVFGENKKQGHFDLDQYKEKWLEELSFCNDAGGDPSNEDHWLHSEQFRSIAIAKMLELMMLKGDYPFVVKGKSYDTIWDFIKYTDVHTVLISDSFDKPKCCVLDVKLKDGTVSYESAMFMPLFDWPLVFLNSYNSDKVDPNNKSVFTFSAGGNGDPEIVGYVASKYISKVVEEDPLIVQNIYGDWGVKLFGTIAHEVAHKIVDDHVACSESGPAIYDESLSAEGAYSVQYKALEHLLINDSSGLFYPKVNDVEEMSIMRIMKKIASKAVCNPEPYQGQSASLLYWYDDDGSYWSYAGDSSVFGLNPYGYSVSCLDMNKYHFASYSAVFAYVSCWQEAKSNMYKVISNPKVESRHKPVKSNLLKRDLKRRSGSFRDF